MKNSAVSLILVSFLVLLVAVPSIAAPIAGDIDGDSRINAVDVQLVINGALGGRLLPDTISLSDTDIDVSGRVDAVDVQLVINGTLGRNIDADDDGLCDAAEANIGTGPDDSDTDDDGIGDGQEMLDGTDPLVSEGVGVLSPATAGFAVLPHSGTAPLEVEFMYSQPAKAHSITSWAWDFDSDGVIDSTEPDPTWIYDTAVDYTVTLTIETDSGGVSEIVKTDCVSVREPVEGEVADNVVCVDNETDLAFVSKTDTSLVLTYAGQDADPIAVGDVVVGTDQGGYARRVLTVDTVGSTITVTTENATLTEIFAAADISGIVEFTTVDMQKAGIPVVRNGIGLLDFDDGVSFGGVDMKGHIEFKPRLDLDAKIKSGDTYLRCAFTGDLNVSFDATLNIDEVDQVWKPAEVSIFELSGISKPSSSKLFIVYGIPVLVYTEFDLLAGARAQASDEMSVSAGFNSSTVVTFGAEYAAGEWDSITDFGLEANRHGPRFTNNASIDGRVYIKPKLSTKLYAMTGPWAAGEVYAGLESTLSPPPATVSLTAGVDLLLGFDLLDLGIFGVDFNLGYSPPPIPCYSRDLDTVTMSGIVSAPATPSFTAYPASGPAPLTVQFTDQSSSGSGSITKRNWNFGPFVTSTATNPSHTFTEPGIYVVSLGVEGTSGSADWQAQRLITVTKPQVAPTADFYVVDPTRGTAPLTVQFYDNSTQGTDTITERAWDLDGDGTIDEYGYNPQWTYTEPGTYDVALVVTSEAGSDAERKKQMIAATSSGGGPVTPGEMISVPAGSFEMGDPWDEGDGDELPVHTVTLSAYEIGKYEVTNGEYADILNWALAQGYLTTVSSSTATAYGHELLEIDDSDCQISYSGGAFVVESRDGYSMADHSMADHPVVELSWYGAAVYCNWLSEANGYNPCYSTTTWECDLSKNGYHLPTEAQWERAAAWTGSTHLRYGNGSDSISSSNVNYDDNNPLGLSGSPYTSPVGYYAGASSPIGCYDMCGNVYEWCNDWYDSGYYSISPETDPEGPNSGSVRVLRGGCWSFIANRCRTAYRRNRGPTIAYDIIGFRLSR